jgi:hypothetical protein
MKLSHLSLLIAVPFIAVGTAFGYTMPGMAPYDGLISIDPGGLPIQPEMLHLNVGAGYWRANKAFDDEGDSEDLKSEPNALIAPLDVGYAFNEHYMADLTFQILRPSETWKPGAADEKTINTFGIGDIWVKARGIWEGGPDFFIGPRLAVKIPVGKVDYEDEKPELGDDQADIDVAAVAGKYGEDTIFKMSGQAGFRYRMKKTMSYVYADPATGQMTAYEYDVTPGVMIYLHVEPGIGTGRDQAFQIYVPIGYAMSMKDTVDLPADWPTGATEPEELDHSSLYLGLYPKYQLDERNAIGLKFMYPVIGTNSPQGMYFTLTYGAFIKL